MNPSGSFDDYPEVMTSAQVAELLGHPVKTIQIWARAGMLPPTGTLANTRGDSTGTSCSNGCGRRRRGRHPTLSDPDPATPESPHRPAARPSKPPWRFP